MELEIRKDVGLKELAAYICKKLEENNIEAVLTGGAAVSIYTENKYQSYDLDFITISTIKQVDPELKKLGFFKEGRYFKHKKTNYFIEFPSGPLSIGEKKIEKVNKIKTKYGDLKILFPTHSLMDRLAAFYFWDDLQSLEQAIMIAKDNKIDYNEVKQWSINEKELDKYYKFIEKLLLNYKKISKKELLMIKKSITDNSKKYNKILDKLKDLKSKNFKKIKDI